MNQQSSSADLGGFAKLGAENFAKIQRELNDIFEETNRYWIGRAKSEAEFASELMAKLTNARSIPDATAVYQEWVSQRMQRLAEDNQQFFSDSQKFLTACTKLAAGGGMGPST
jgi:RIO-like serine/threonine protein kinase